MNLSRAVRDNNNNKKADFKLKPQTFAVTEINQVVIIIC